MIWSHNLPTAAASPTVESVNMTVSAEPRANPAMWQAPAEGPLVPALSVISGAPVAGVNSPMFWILAPGTHIPDHRGVTKGLITCHLGLIVPRDGDVRMRVHDRVVRWAEGETLVFDDTYHHEVWNDTAATRVVLLVQFERPLRNPGKWIAERFLGFVKRSAFVQEARANIGQWNAAVKQLDV